MTTHSSVLAWRIPGTGEPGGLLSMGSHTESDTTEVTQQQQQHTFNKCMQQNEPNTGETVPCWILSVTHCMLTTCILFFMGDLRGFLILTII